MIDIFSLKVEEIASKIKDAQLTSVEVCEKYIERIKKFEKDVKAWAHFDKKLLLEKAFLIASNAVCWFSWAVEPTGIFGVVINNATTSPKVRKNTKYNKEGEIIRNNISPIVT